MWKDKFKWILLGSVVIMMFSLSACPAGVPPTQEINEAKAMVEKAEQESAKDYAKDEYQKAVETLNLAVKLTNEKKYKEAKDQAIISKEQATISLSKSAIAKAEILLDKSKGLKADVLEPQKFSTAESNIVYAKQLFQQKDYTNSYVNASNAIALLTALNAELEEKWMSTRGSVEDAKRKYEEASNTEIIKKYAGDKLDEARNLLDEATKYLDEAKLDEAKEYAQKVIEKLKEAEEVARERYAKEQEKYKKEAENLIKRAQELLQKIEELEKEVKVLKEKKGSIVKPFFYHIGQNSEEEDEEYVDVEIEEKANLETKSTLEMEGERKAVTQETGIEVMEEPEEETNTANPVKEKEKSLEDIKPYLENAIKYYEAENYVEAINQASLFIKYGEEYLNWLQAYIKSLKEKKEVSVKEEGVVEYKVKRGDYLAKIAELIGGYYWWPKIFHLNKDKIKDPDLIETGDTLKLPKQGKLE